MPRRLEDKQVLDQRVYRLVSDFVGAWNGRDVDGLATLYADDALYEDLRLAVTLRGRPAILAHFRQVMGACTDAALALGAAPVASGDRAYFEWMTVANCDGHTQELRGVSVMLVEDGRIVRQTDYPHPLAPRAAFETATVAVAATVEDNVAWGE